MFSVLTAVMIFLIPQILAGQNTFKHEQDRYPRVHQARENCEHDIDSFFIAKELNYPPEEILIVAYKKEKLIHLWARSDTSEAFLFIKEYPFTAFSGTLGPKRKQGDLQIPEGFYYISHFNPYSNFHLSMKISYPNKSDSILGKKGSLGNEIRIHGSFVTIGCIPIGDKAIEELYIICVDMKSKGQYKIPVYIFPGKMDRQNWVQLKNITGQDSVLLRFWYNLREGYDLFKATQRKLVFHINKQGEYLFAESHAAVNVYPWMNKNDIQNTLCDRIDPPIGFERQYCAINSCAAWLRYLPLKPGNPKICLYNENEKSYQNGHYAVVDIDVGQEDLQQCADAIIRLYAEYSFSKKEYSDISFNLTNGDAVGFRKWISGYRPVVSGNTVTWQKSALPDSSYNTFRAYLKFIFTYAGTYSLSQETQCIEDHHEMMIGDIFIEGGFPGHAVLVVDMAVNPRTEETIFLLCQSYMPAQDIHILKNLNAPNLTPWYKLDFGDNLYTPEWTFKKEHLRRIVK
jgi:murein L,D-transpeptidase YafK